MLRLTDFDNLPNEGSKQLIWNSWRRRQNTPNNKLHPMEQRPVKLAPFPTDRERLRVSLRADRHVVVQSFRDRVYLNIREFYQHDGTKKWLPRKKGINMILEDWKPRQRSTKLFKCFITLYKREPNNSIEFLDRSFVVLLDFKASRMGHSVKAFLWCDSLVIITRFSFFYFRMSNK